ncbi:UDP-glycosyltransferase UGT5-like [Cylas formicarius]|uniref:UDP-glycosyltransferase UGT5-like n=1 Tax=Cylas formicarius TaxID=197179 RepID=UPI0029589F58|nr:UDP-glycosyltransferase UGT5-like [Cylas formicarius]
MRLFKFLLVFHLVFGVKCHRLLVLFTLPTRSHDILGTALVKGLAEHGFDVTYVGLFEDKTPPTSYRKIVLTGFLEEYQRILAGKFTVVQMEQKSPFQHILMMNEVGNALTDSVLKHPNIQKLVQSNEHFDAVIMEQGLNDGLKILASHFRAPLVIFSSLGPNPWINNIVGNPEPPSYIPNIFLDFPPEMNFFQRIYNFVFAAYSKFNLDYVFYPEQSRIVKKYFLDAPAFDEVLYNVSLVLLNSHESVTQPVPLVPNMINIGGYHVRPPNELPKDLKEFMDNATEGVIYFSLGSHVDPSLLPDSTLQAISRVLGSRQEKILWKWPLDTLPDQSKNVRISKWFPQQDILAHPNLKLFITHCGLLSTTETVYHGVPILALPAVGDQKLNAAHAESLGLGRKLFPSEITEESFKDALNDVLDNPKYRDNIKYRSSVLHDRPVSPIQLAAYWVGYVIKQKGAPHLRVAGARMPFYKYLMLDVIAVIIFAMCSVSYAFSKIVGKILRPKNKLKKS